MLKVETNSPEETRRWGEIIGARLRPGSVVCLFGELGAGKTTFTQGLAAGLGVKEKVVSPSFIFAQEYKGKTPFYHLDAYRLQSLGELEELGLEEYLTGQGVAVLEWAEKMASFLPPSYLKVEIKRVPGETKENKRQILISAVGENYSSLLVEK